LRLDAAAYPVVPVAIGGFPLSSEDLRVVLGPEELFLDLAEGVVRVEDDDPFGSGQL
jgi:hypothetical protein